MTSLLRRLFGLSRRSEGSVIHYTGHRILADPSRSRFPAKRERAIAKAIGTVVKREGVVAGYGGLASGSDILIAEALVNAGADLHVVLPCEEDRYLEASVLEAGAAWGARFEGMIAEAASLTFLETEDEIEEEPIDFSGASDIAMDMASEEAKQTALELFQLALFDGEDSEAKAGTGADIERGKDFGWRQIILLIGRRGKIRVL
jgi:hypothetical protein